MESNGRRGGTRTPDPRIRKLAYQGYLVDFATRLETLSHGEARLERSSCTDLVLVLVCRTNELTTLGLRHACTVPLVAPQDPRITRWRPVIDPVLPRSWTV